MALTGIGAPIALSFVLLRLLSATPLQAFAAGAALSATSLGTTFTILTTTELIKTRLGVVTTSAAMLDDVVGLVMVQVITNLGKGGSAESSFNAMTVVRPIFVSIGFAVGVVLVCKFVFKPLLNLFLSSKAPIPKFMKTFHFAFLAHTCVLVGLVAGATYAGTSSLFAAYLAGAVISWFDEISGLATGGKPEEVPAPGATDGNTEQGSRNVEVREQPVNRRTRLHDRPDSGNTSSSSTEESQEPMPNLSPREVPTGELVYERYYKEPLNRLLKPLFFVSSMYLLHISWKSSANKIKPIGIHRLRHSHHGDVPRGNRLAGHRLRYPDGVRKTDHGPVACQDLIGADMHIPVAEESEIDPIRQTHLLCAYFEKQDQRESCRR